MITNHWWFFPFGISINLSPFLLICYLKIEAMLQWNHSTLLKERKKGKYHVDLHNHVDYEVYTESRKHTGISAVQSLSSVRLSATSWTAACQASLSITNSRSQLKLMSSVLVLPSNHLILCRPLLLPSMFPSLRVFPNESVLCIRWPKYGV